MLIYTAGPYSQTAGVGTVEENIQKAKEVAVELWNMGYTVLCPHLNTAGFETLTTLSNKDFVDRDLEMVEVCDAIVMMPGWESSLGAVRELEHARQNDLVVWFWPEVPVGAEKSVEVRKGHRLKVTGTRISQAR
jgi:hypothetical protein